MDHALGIESTTLAAAVRAANAINTVRPALVDPARGDYRRAPPPTFVAVFTAMPALTGRARTTFTVTFDRVVRGVTLDDFALLRDRVRLSLAGASLTTADNRTFTITGVPGTNLAGSSTLRLRATGTGITDLAGAALAVPASTTWRMTRSLALPSRTAW